MENWKQAKLSLVFNIGETYPALKLELRSSEFFLARRVLYSEVRISGMSILKSH